MGQHTGFGKLIFRECKSFLLSGFPTSKGKFVWHLRQSSNVRVSLKKCFFGVTSEFDVRFGFAESPSATPKILNP